MLVDPSISGAHRSQSLCGHTNVAAADSGGAPASGNRASTAQRDGSIDYFDECDDGAAFDDADPPEGRPADSRRVTGVVGSLGADDEEAEAPFEPGDLDDPSFDPLGDGGDAERRREGRDGPRRRAPRQQRKSRGSILDMVISFSRRRSSNGGGRTPSSKEGDGRQEGTNVLGTSGKTGSSGPGDERCANSSKRRQGRRSRNHETGTPRGSIRGSLLAVIDAIKSKAGGRHPATEGEELPSVPASHGYYRPKSTRAPDRGPSRDERGRGAVVDASALDRSAEDGLRERRSLLRRETASTTMYCSDRTRESSDDDAGRGSGAGGTDRADPSGRRRGRRGRAKDRGSPPPRGSLRAMVDAAMFVAVGRRGSAVAHEDEGRSCKYSAYVNAGRGGEAGAEAGSGGSGDEMRLGVALDYDEGAWGFRC